MAGTVDEKAGATVTSGEILTFYFGWPTGAVWSNLLASLICSIIVWWRLRARMIIHHNETLAQQERHHRELKNHITATVEDSRLK